MVGQDLAEGSARELGVRSDVTWSPGSRSLLEIGGDLAWRDESLVFRQYGSTPAGSPVVAFTNASEAASSAQSAYANLQWRGPAGMSIAPVTIPTLEDV